MIDTLLHARLRPVIERRQQFAFWRSVALIWLAAALAGWGLVYFRGPGTHGPGVVGGWLVVGALAATGACGLRRILIEPDLRDLARTLEARHRDLDGRLLTAIQQVPDKMGDYQFLQERLFEDAVRHSVDHDWAALVPGWRVTAARVTTVMAVGALVGAMVTGRPPRAAAVLASATGGETSADGVTVTPGDASVEKGSPFTVMARFDQEVPASADLVVGEAAESERRVPLVKSLADPVFGATLPGVEESFSYRVDYAGRRTRAFKVAVFEYPRLERSDVDLIFPSYTGLPPQRIEDTRRISAVEGTQVALALQLNKPVASASLVPKDKKSPAVPLIVDPASAIARLAGFGLATSESYELRLVDADGRTNKTPDLFVFDALPNRPPELKLAAPRGDTRPSALEEIAFDGTAWDDFGVLAYGLAWARGGQAPEFIELGRDVPARETQSFQHRLCMEAVGAKPDDLFSWFVWADDIGPDGQRRRTQGDLFFGEVRPFEEIFREGAGSEGGEPPPGGQGNQASRLAELQKQIINATWKLQRTQPPAPSYPQDATVVRDSQAQAIGQAKKAAGEVVEPGRAALWQAATGWMDKAFEKLAAAPAAPAVLPEALTVEQSAYQALLKLQAREHEVSRRQNQQGQAAAGDSPRQKELDELELEQSENRYEMQRQAAPTQSAERREQMQVQNRLQELARRQDDVNTRLKDLQAALQAAADEPQRDELRRQLKRLEEEQRQMVADIDEARQRMNRPENQSQMSRQREQMDQTRQDAQRAADAAARGEVSQALAAGTRAQRQLQDVRDQLRKQGAGQFADELRQMRAEARDLARQQEEISRHLDDPVEPRRRSLSDPADGEETLQQLARQRDRAASLVDRATQLSQEAEAAEPLVSRQLYDSLRQFSQTDSASVKQARQDLIRDGLMTRSLYQQLQEMQEKPTPGQALSLTSELLRAELSQPAQTAARQARTGIEQLRGGVERAAEKVLGDDTAALQLAEKELDSLADEVAREAAEGQGATKPGPEGQPGDPGRPGDPGQGEALAQQAGGQQPGNAREPGERAPTDAPSRDGGPGAGRPGQVAQQAGRSRDSGPGESTPRGDAAADEAAPQGSESAQAGPSRGGRQGGPRGGQEGGERGGVGAESNERVSRLFGGRESSGGRGGAAAPITGEGFTNWSDRLREVEEMIEFPDLRNEVASARERARLVRQDSQRELKKPDWAVVQLEILKPLVEVRQQVRDELRRRSSDQALVPIDRDPVPPRFAEQVRRYYEELGKEK